MTDMHAHAKPEMFETMIAWVRRMMAESKRTNELRSVDRAMLSDIARDLNLSASDLEVIAASDGRSDERLERQLATFGLSPEIIRLRYPEVMRDLRRVCGGCSSAKACDHAQSSGDLAAQRAIDCPNMQTLEALQAGEQESKAALPVGPCCC
jgi:hypothetical protein